MDATPRELYLLFRAYQGYEGSLLKLTSKPGKSSSPVGFVTFDSRAGAESAKQALSGVRFDPDQPQTIRLEFAKSNTKVTKPKQTSPQPANLPMMGPHPAQLTPRDPYDLSTAVFLPHAAEAWAHHPNHKHAEFINYQGLAAAYADLTPATPVHHHPVFAAHPALHAQVPADGARVTYVLPHHAHSAVAHAPHPHPATTSLPQQTLPMNMANAATMAAIAGSAPCSTLFIANLGTGANAEQELRDLCSSLPGFTRLRVHNKGGAPCCFVEFQNISCATQALTHLQGVLLPSSDRGGLRVEFAKANMGEKTLEWSAGGLIYSPSPAAHHPHQIGVTPINRTAASPIFQF
ncbi:cell wall integrity protein scw1-like isoform X2 [Patiria miniata]|uniref:RRM domain-containing protein n=1 Tax=Patiria miniata TaxID=46514 RepID=A0A913Z781_PATMI|nr:cell wall integrity protein scw1-like isoform X2 [Patiria miniata]